MPARVNLPPNNRQIESKNPQNDLWFQEVSSRMNMYSGTANPTTTQVPQGQWILYKNTSLNEVRWWVNDSGTMKKSAAFT